MLASPASAQTAGSDAAADSPVSDLSVSIGSSVWHGDFGARTETTIVSALAGVRYRHGGLRLSASIPRMRIESDGSFFAGIGGTPLFVAPNISAPRRVRDGWGDLTLGASYLLPGGEARGFDVDLSGRVKIPTASGSSGLSTGKVDYSGGAELSKTYGRITPAVSVTYRVFGDNRTWSFRDGFDITAGGTYALTSKTALLVNYEYVQASSRFIGDSHELLAGISMPAFSDRLRATGYVSKGLSSGSAAISGGASLSLTF